MRNSINIHQTTGKEAKTATDCRELCPKKKGSHEGERKKVHT